MAVRVRAGHRDRYVTITGIDPNALLQRIVGAPKVGAALRGQANDMIAQIVDAPAPSPVASTWADTPTPRAHTRATKMIRRTFPSPIA